MMDINIEQMMKREKCAVCGKDGCFEMKFYLQYERCVNNFSARKPLKCNIDATADYESMRDSVALCDNCLVILFSQIEFSLGESLYWMKKSSEERDREAVRRYLEEHGEQGK